jgi:periplasmic protein TonB
LKTGALRTPTRIPQKVQMIKEDEAPPPMATGGVVGGVPGGIPGGQLGGVIGGIVSAEKTVAIPKLDPPKRVRVSQGVTLGLRVRYVEAEYPQIARVARITGSVQLRAIIGKDGTIKELEATSGHPILVKSAIEAVKQWQYRPYLLNGEAVEVETNITVSFNIAS